MQLRTAGPDVAACASTVDLAPYEMRLPPAQSVPFVFNSPHSGRCYPTDFLAAIALDRTAVRRSEDFLVDRLIAPVVDVGAPMLHATFPRAFLDVNREPYELDPKMFSGRLPSFANVRSLRVAGGLGTIPRVVSDGANIYRTPLDVREGLERIDRVYRPYHDALRRLLAQTYVRFGQAVLIDCHSMPSDVRTMLTRGRPDFVLGDRFGTSCAPDLIDAATRALEGLGYSVCRNKPYAGGFITEHYGRPARGLHALQIEINRALYMDEGRLEPHSGFDRLAGDFRQVAEHLFTLFGEKPEAIREAAE